MDSLPQFSEPTSFDAALSTALVHSRNVHENAYLLGKHLNYLRRSFTKEQKRKHGGFWVFAMEQFGFSDNTGRYLIDFAVRCDEAGYLLPYHPGLEKRAQTRENAATRPIDYAERYSTIEGIMGNYFPEAWSLGRQQESAFNFPIEERRQRALNQLAIELTSDQRALIWLGVYLAGGLNPKSKAA